MGLRIIEQNTLNLILFLLFIGASLRGYNSFCREVRCCHFANAKLYACSIQLNSSSSKSEALLMTRCAVHRPGYGSVGKTVCRAGQPFFLRTFGAVA